jgi:alkaline phosphatase
MKERLVVLSTSDGEVGVTLGALYRYLAVPINGTIVAVYSAPNVDDAGLDIDLDNVTDSSAIVTAMACAVKATPGSWLTPGYGGTNTPVAVDAGDILSLDANDAAANTTITVNIWMLTGEVSA